MKADVYTSFLTSKVKVFSTQKGGEPKVISGRAIRKTMPVLLASVMSFSGGCVSKASSMQVEDDGSHKAIELLAENVSFDAVRFDKEYLSEAEIAELMANPQAPVLKDKNFNHLPENIENFWEIVRNGVAFCNQVQSSSKLNHKQKAEYKITAHKMLAQISRSKGTVDEVDLLDFNNLKAFLFFEKVVKHQDRYWKVLGQSQGVIDERADAFGRYCRDQEMLKEKMKTAPEVLEFAKAMYASEEKCVLSYNDSIQANQMSRAFLSEWLERQQITDKNLWYFADTNEYDYCNTLAVYSSRGNNLEVVLGVDPKGDLGNGQYSPVGVVIVHELQHLMQRKPASNEKAEDNQKPDDAVQAQRFYYDNYAAELAPTLYSLALEDGFYKKIHGIDKDKVVDYGMIELKTHKVSIGKLAVWFNQMVEKYPHKSIDKVILEPEVFNHLKELGRGTNTNTVLLQQAHLGR